MEENDSIFILSDRFKNYDFFDFVHIISIYFFDTTNFSVNRLKDDSYQYIFKAFTNTR